MAKRRKLLLRLVVLAALLATGFVLLRFTPVGEYFQRERIIALLEELRHRPWTPAALVAVFGVTTPMGFPASPMVVAGGMVFGPLLGTAYNVLGLLAGAMITFWIGRGLGRDAVLHLAGPRLKRAEAVFHKRGFWPLVQVRFLPIPFPIVSYAAALAGVSQFRFFLTTLLGLIPATAVHTYFAPRLILETMDGEEPVGLLVGYLLSLVFLNVVVVWPQVREGLRRRRRYRELVAEREERDETTE